MAPETTRGVVIQPPERGRYLPMGDFLYQQEEVNQTAKFWFLGYCLNRNEDLKRE